jgi:phosphatidylserine/phosphatidylglycerophosphate/cardiolipin synthase-like enzyme
MDIHEALTRTLDDRRLSRGERQALSQVLSEVDRDPSTLDHWRQAAFAVARTALSQPADAAVLEWLEDVVRLLRPSPEEDRTAATAEAYFSPGEDCPRAILRRIHLSRRTIDACVFTITDDRLSDALIDAHRRGVAVRIVSDDAKADDPGSDVDRLEQAGIAVRFDRSPFHMHHKFAVFDGTTLLNGSYNWTRGAARDNQENLTITIDRGLVAIFAAQFDRLWEALG